MPGKAQKLSEIRTLLRPIFREAHDEDSRENPRNARLPFFHPLTVTRGDGQRHSAFSRDLSANSIGLLHNFALAQEGEVGISIATGRGYSVKVRVRILWCRPCGEDWYVSGGNFTSIPAIG
jgi:hypothetical protein